MGSREVQTTGLSEVQTTGLSEDLELDTPVAGEWKKYIRQGEDYQAEIPEFTGPPCVEDSSPDNEETTLLWASASMENLTKTQVDDFIKQICGEGEKARDASKEHSMHVLHQTGGDIQEAISILTSGTGLELLEGHPMVDYTYSGREDWSDEEIDRFFKSLRLHGKKFRDVSKHIRTKTLQQCIQYFYVWKKLFIKKYRLIRPGKDTLAMQPAVTDSHNTRGSSRRAVAAAARRANEAAQMEDPDVSLALDDSLSQPVHGNCSKSQSPDRVEEEMECVVGQGAGTSQQANCQNALNVAGSSTYSTPNDKSSPALPKPIFPCTFEDCHKFFHSNRSLQSHLSWHKKSSPNRSAQIKQNGHRTTTRTSPVNHSGEMVFPCTKCDRVFAKMKSRNAHMKCHKST